MIELSLSLIILGITLAGLGLAFEQRTFTFISAFVFLLLGFTSDNTWILVIMILLFIMQMFNSFFEWRR